MKKYKQDSHIYKPYLHTLFVNFFLFTLAGSIYGLITGGVGNLLSIPVYVIFAVCTTFFICKAYSIIYTDDSHRKNSKVIKKDDVLGTDRCLELEGLINLSGDQRVSNQEQGCNPYTGGILTPEAVQNVIQDNKSNLVSPNGDDKNHGSQQSSPSTSHTHGTGSFISNSLTNQAVSRTVRSIFNPYPDREIGDLLQSQNVTSPKPTAPTPPPIPKGDLFANKTGAQLQKNKTQCESTFHSTPKLSGELLISIRNFNQGSLKKQKGLEQKYTHSESTTVSGLGFLLKNVLEERRQVSAFSDSEDDSDSHSAHNSDEWKEDIKTSVKTPQEENGGEVTRIFLGESNHNASSYIGGEVRLKKVGDNTDKMQKPSSLFRSSSLTNLNGIDEQQKLRNLLDSSTSLNLEECI